MKCLKCGATINKKDKYCGDCGAKVTMPKKENSFLKFIKKNAYTICQVIIIIMLCFIIGLILVKKADPETVADKYIKAIANNDTEAIYKYFDVSDSDFVSLNTLNDKIDKIENMSNIEVVNKKIVGNEAIITYKYNVGSSTYFADVSLTKSGKKFLVLDNWKVNSGKLVSNITIEVPKDAKVTVDNISLDKYLNNDNSSEYVDTYIIDNMVIGEYSIEVTLLDGTVVDSDITVSNNGYYSIGNVDLVDESKESIQNSVKTTLQDLYNNLINNVTYDNLSYNDNIKKLYRNLKYNYTNSNMTLNGIEITDAMIENTRVENGNLVATLEIEYNYDINYQVSDSSNNYTGTNRSNITVQFIYEDGYVINNIENLNLNFKIRK
jgi:uncharacterized membrane protein YvbJ